MRGFWAATISSLSSLTISTRKIFDITSDGDAKSIVLPSYLHSAFDVFRPEDFSDHSVNGYHTYYDDMFSHEIVKTESSS